jgi:hypothetical protein
MYIFAQNAVTLPTSPELYRNDIAYSSPITDALITNGIPGLVNVETSQINFYLNQLSIIIDNLSEMGIASIYPSLFSLENAVEGDIKRDADDPFNLVIFTNNTWKKIFLKASETNAGFINLELVLNNDDPLKLFPISKHDSPGVVYIDNTMTKNEFNNLRGELTSQILNDEGGIRDDNNDYGESYYFSEKSLTINLFPNRPTSKFYLKHLRINPLTMTLNILGNLYNELPADIYILNDGNIFG